MRLAVNLILIFLSLFIVLSCSDAEQKKEPDKKITFRCTADILDSSGTRFAEATGKELFFQNVDCQSDLAAFSGNYSSRQTPEKPYGFTTVIHDVKPDDYIKVSAWRKSKNENGVIAIDGGNGFYNAEKKLIENNNGWQKITAEYFVPPNFNSGDLKIYTWNNGPDTVFFDDFSITHKKSKDYPKYENISSLHFYIDDRDLDKFNQKGWWLFKTPFWKTTMKIIYPR